MNKAIAVIAKILTNLPGSRLTTHILDLSFDGSEEAVELQYSHKDDTRTFRGPNSEACLIKLATSYLVELSTMNMFGSDNFKYDVLTVVIDENPDDFRRKYFDLENVSLKGDIKIGSNISVDSFFIDNLKITNGGYLSARLNFPRRFWVLDAVALSHAGRVPRSPVDAFKFHPRTATKFGETEFITYDLEII